MYDINVLMGKLNQRDATFAEWDVTLSDLMPLSLTEIKQMAGNNLSLEESSFIYKQAQREFKNNKIIESRILARENPQIARAVRLGIRSLPQTRSYDEWFGSRSGTFVHPGSVASMFSPAGYLTELYREAAYLHDESSSYHLNKRRPDLASLALSQQNMDEEISTLTLFSELLLDIIQSKEGLDYSQVMEMLSTYRLTGQTPYHLPYESTRQSILLQDSQLLAFNRNMAVAKHIDTVSMLAIDADISPELFTILTEDITAGNTEALFKKNFGDNADVNQLVIPSALANYYGLSLDELTSYFEVDLAVSSDSDYYAYILRLNKAIRLCRATGFTPYELQSIVDSTNNDGTIDKAVLTRIFYTLYFKKRTGVTLENALVICGSDITQSSRDNTPSQFDRLFNTPPLSGRQFLADGTVVNLDSDSAEDAFQRAVLKRAFQVTDGGLVMLWQLVIGEERTKLTCSPGALSDMYRVALLAQSYHLTVSELCQLISFSSYAGQALGELSDADLFQLTQFVSQSTQWITEQGCSINDVALMFTDSYSLTLSPDIENLVATLKHGLADPKLSGAALIKAAAPLIAATLQLDSSETAQGVLAWIDKLQPQGLSLDAFQDLVMEDSLSEEETRKLVGVCQVLGQLSLIVRSIGLGASELSLAVNQATFQADGVLPRSFSTLQTLARFHALINRCGQEATEVLTALGEQQLTPEQVARALNLNRLTVISALKQVDPAASVFKDWLTLDEALQWMDIAATLGLSPAGVSALMDLDFFAPPTDTTWSEWVNISDMLQAGLDPHQNEMLQASLTESTSAALSAYFLHQHRPGSSTDRNALYSYLLIDNQVSSQIKTTRLAEAIASIQLYVNRAFYGLETGVKTAVKTRPFFSEWEQYNKRYSTWVGVSQLVYYPENYIDPTLRLGQTTMANNLIQSISQSQLSTSTVEEAFKSYLTEFEQVANLQVISGYHAHVVIDQGLSYFIGRNASEQVTYYWRSADHDKAAKDGTIPANGWAEWRKINNGASPFTDLIRPVVLNHRLYLVWAEQHEVAESQVSGSEATITYRYALKLSYLRYDGSWSPAVSFDITLDIEKVLAKGPENIGLYCSFDDTQERLICVFYGKKAKDEEGEHTCEIITIDAEMVKDIVSGSPKETIYANSVLEYETLTERTLNNQYNAAKESDFSYHISSTPASKGPTKTHPTVDFIGTKVLKASIADSTETQLTLDLSVFCACQINNTSLSEDELAVINILVDAEIKIDVNTLFLLKVPVIFSYIQPGETDREDYDFFLYAVLDVSSKNLYFLLYDYNGNVPEKGFLLQVSFMVGPADGDESSIKLKFTEEIPDLIGVMNLTDKQLDYILHAENAPFIEFKQFFSILSLVPPKIVISEFEDRKRFTFKQGAYEFIEGVKDLRLSFVPKGGTDSSYDFLGWNQSKEEWLEPGPNSFTSKPLTKAIPIPEFSSSNTSTVQVTFAFTDKADEVLANYVLDLPVTRTQKAINVISLISNPNGAQYIQIRKSESDLKNIRLNTLFARQLIARANVGLDAILTLETQKITEPPLDDNKQQQMDFAGANAIYFWELFYYIPMAVFLRLYQEQNYPEATRWLHYVWNPAGYVVNGSPEKHLWNVRPLEEDTSWNDSPLDEVDPDAVAQNDPMHYKVSTFMRTLDLLIAQGDAAYRKLERDTLNEAKMWYIQALTLLGDEPYTPLDKRWSNPALGDVADQTVRTHYQNALQAVQRVVEPSTLRTASSLTGLFQPQQNEKLLGYWQTLALRLYNLRHNLSIDGHPLSLSVYAKPANPAALLTAAVSASLGGGDLPQTVMPAHRFPVILNSAQNMVGQLIQFGNTLLSITGQQDAEALAELLQTQGSALFRQQLTLQENTLAEIDAEKEALQALREGARSRFDSYSTLYDENINAGEKQAMELSAAAGGLRASGTALHMAAAAADLVPNIYGMAVGGSRLGGMFNAAAIGIEIAVGGMLIQADKTITSEHYRRRHQEWDIQRHAAESEMKQVDAQLKMLDIRRESGVLQKSLLETQQAQTQAQLAFLQEKFGNTALFHWLRGRLSAIYYQFYDLTVSCCLMAEQAWQYELNDSATSFIRPGAWQGTYGGLLAGESLALNLAQMEQAFLQKEERSKNLTRTVCLSEVYKNLPEGRDFTLADKIVELVNSGQGSAGEGDNSVTVTDGQLKVTLKLSDLNIQQDYPDTLGKTRRIKQISVTLPALVGPYQDVRAVLSYGGSLLMPRGCEALAVSHGMNDSGQFQLDFNDPRWLPFEGIPVSDSGNLTLSFPDADDRQKDLLLSLTDIILHIRYTIIR